MQLSVNLRRMSFWILPVAAIGVGALAALFGPRLWTGASSASQGDEPPVDDEPALVLNTNSLDFGETLDGTRLRLPVTVTNTSSQPVDVVRIMTTCGCTAIVDALPIRIAAGEARELVFEMNTARTAGPVRSRIAIETQEHAGTRTYPLEAAARVRLAVTMSADLLDLGALRRTDTKRGEILVSLHRSSGDAEPLKFMSVPKGLRATLKEVKPVAGEPRQWRVECSLDGAAVMDEPLDADLVIAVPSTVDPHRRVRVRARSLTTVTAAQDVINFDFFSPAAPPAEQPVALIASEGRPFHIVSVHPIDAPFVQATIEQDGDDGIANLSIHLNSTECPKGFFKGKLRVVYQCENGEEIVSLVAQGYCR